MLLTEGQMSDHTGAKLLYPKLPPADTLIADKGYDSDGFREALAARKIKACIPSKRNRKIQHAFDKQLYRPATRSRTCSAGSRTGGASQPATTAAPTPSSPPSASPPPSSSGSINES